MKVIRLGARWLLVPVAAAAVVAACVLAARGAVAIADGRCAAASMVGGTCVEPWHTSMVEAAIYTAVVAAVAGLVTLPALIAPHLKRTVAVVLFLGAVGVIFNAYLLSGWAAILGPLAVAVVTGGLALWWVWSWRRST